jgi:hypothetical protein
LKVTAGMRLESMVSDLGDGIKAAAGQAKGPRQRAAPSLSHNDYDLQ